MYINIHSIVFYLPVANYLHMYVLTCIVDYHYFCYNHMYKINTFQYKSYDIIINNKLQSVDKIQLERSTLFICMAAKVQSPWESSFFYSSTN